MNALSCRLCDAALHSSFCDLGLSPLANAYIPQERLQAPELFYPLQVFVCDQCRLVQLPPHESPERIFGTDYAYFSSYSDTWLDHCRAYARDMIPRLGLTSASRVVELASNDGYLLQFFLAAGVQVLGVEPAANCARAAEARGISTRVQYFGSSVGAQIATDGGADLLVANNVLAHVPELNDFIAGIKLALKPDGLVTLEFPHLLSLIQGNQFDTIYHEHYSYFSLLSSQRAFARHGLAVTDLDELSTHGGSLRLYLRHESIAEAPSERVRAFARREQDAGLGGQAAYAVVDAQARQAKRELLRFLLDANAAGKRVWAYGAAAKGNTLLNFCGIGQDLIAAVADRSPHKQGRFLPGSRIPILDPQELLAARPDYVLILPWNIRDEITAQLAAVRQWGGQFVTAIPGLQVQ